MVPIRGGGGLMDLIAYGPQDVYLCGYLFRIYYQKRIINNIVTKIEIIKYEFIEYIEVENNKEEIKNIFNKSFDAIDCSKLNIKKLPKFKIFDDFYKLKYFNCSFNKLQNIEKLKYINLIKLDCSYNIIKNIPFKMKLLEYFDFSNNNVGDDLDLINYPKLKYLLASSNKIKKILNYPQELVYLDLSNNQIDSLDNLPNLLEYLLVVQTRIKKINFTKLVKLKYLDISINNFGDINGLPY